jgi:hypothetical protein
MKVFLPYFDQGTEYRCLSKDERGGRRWLYVTLVDIEVGFADKIVADRFHLLDRKDFEWGTITANHIRVRKGYAWNGSSCSPDFRANMLASLVHDLLYQFSGCPQFPATITRGWADSMFYAICRKEGFALRSLYRLGLWLGGWSCWAKPPVDGEHVEVAYQLPKS